jgi:hypothetical protein
MGFVDKRANRSLILMDRRQFTRPPSVAPSFLLRFASAIQFPRTTSHLSTSRNLKYLQQMSLPKPFVCILGIHATVASRDCHRKQKHRSKFLTTRLSRFRNSLLMSPIWDQSKRRSVDYLVMWEEQSRPPRFSRPQRSPPPPLPIPLQLCHRSSQELPILPNWRRDRSSPEPHPVSLELPFLPRPPPTRTLINMLLSSVGKSMRPQS